jgi:septum site-determining protein MinD
MSRIIVITSGKGGVGKTTTAINLAAAMNYFGKDVLIIDSNISTPNVGIHLGAPEVPITLNHILNKKVDPFEAVYEHESGVKIIPSSLSMKESTTTRSDRLKLYKNAFKELAENIILDSAAGLGAEAQASIELADEIIIVTNPEMPAITDALKTIKLAEEKGKRVSGVIMTRVRKDSIEMSPESVKEMLEVPILGMVPEDITIKESLNQKDAVIHTHPKSKSSRAYKEIAARLVNVPYDSDTDKEKFWERVTRFFKKKQNN